MRNIFALTALVLTLTGCASAIKSPYGNHLHPASADQQKLAGEVVLQLAVIWPPAKTRFDLQHETHDPFGAALIKRLRESGYALLEYTNPSDLNAEAKADSPEEPGSASDKKSFALRYVLDQAGTPNMYRLTMMVGNQSITRAYFDEGGSFVPAGSWVRKE